VDALWDGEWRENLLRAALDRVKARVNPAHYERYHLHVVQGLSARETARALDTNTAAVHLATHRVGKLVKAELKRLQAEEKTPFGGGSGN
jgi:DNA-directed RNA polymerase specialized sigma24 family protein